MLLNNQWTTEENKEEIKKYLQKNKMKHKNPKPMGCSKRSSKREVDSNISFPQKTWNISNKQPNLTPKGTRETRTNKTQS